MVLIFILSPVVMPFQIYFAMYRLMLKIFSECKKLEITQKLPMMGFIQGESADVMPKAASVLSLSKQDDKFMLASSVTDSQIKFKSNNAQLMVAFAFMPITTNGILHDYTYDIIINDKNIKLKIMLHLYLGLIKIRR